MRLQHQLSNGAWRDCGEKTEGYLADCQEWNGPDETGNLTYRHEATRDATRDEILAALADGHSVRNDRDDWYSVCRDGAAVEALTAARRIAQPLVEMRRCACGHTVPARSVMSTSRGSSCPECYDRMSD